MCVPFSPTHALPRNRSRPICLVRDSSEWYPYAMQGDEPKDSLSLSLCAKLESITRDANDLQSSTGVSEGSILHARMTPGRMILRGEYSMRQDRRVVAST